MGNEYWPKCGDALRQDGSFYSLINVWVAGKRCETFNTFHPERFRDEFILKIYVCTFRPHRSVS